MIELQDKQILHRYFADMLFRPMTEAVSESLAPAAVETSAPENIPVVEKELVDQSQNLQQQETTAGPQARYHEGDNYRWENQRPPWAQENFDCLLFDVSGFSFAVPLVTLGQIQLVSDKLSPVFGQAPWFMGIQATPMGKLRVVNTAQLVMPERYQSRDNYRPTYMISIANCHWALAVDEVKQPISLAPDAVKWRVNRERQSWLAGVIKQEMCVLIDIPALARQLMESDENS